MQQKNVCDLNTSYPIPKHIEIKCMDSEIHVYKKIHGSFYRNQAYDLELIKILQNKNEFEEYLKRF